MTDLFCTVILMITESLNRVKKEAQINKKDQMGGGGGALITPDK